MLEANEYTRVMEKLYGKSLILENPSEFHPVLYFYFIDALSHIDYTLTVLSYSPMSPRNIMSMEYLRWRVDEAKVGERAYFPDFVNWLKTEHPEKFDELPLLWSGVYDSDDPAQYRSFRIVLDPDQKSAIPAGYLSTFIDEFFDPAFIKQLYNTSALARLFDEYARTRSA